MLKLLLATTNKNKILEIKEMIKSFDLKNIEVISLEDLKDYDEVVEDNETLEGNAFLKASYFASKYKDYFIVSDDSGIFVPSLKGNPGVHSKRYSESGTDEDNRIKLLVDLKNKDRKAYYQCSICFIDLDRKTHYFTGKTYGKILEEEIGSFGFGYDYIFYSTEINKPFGLTIMEEKNKISHRGRAIKELLEYLKVNYGL